MSDSPPIRFDFNLQRGGFRLQVAAEIPGRGVTALFGHSGSGKSSLLRCLAGLERPDKAALQVAGDTWHDSVANIFLPPHQRRVGYVFQQGALFPHLTVRDNLCYGQRRNPDADDQARLDEQVELLGLQRLLGAYPAQLSGGERQRVAIGRALLARPRLLLMDEPMAALDRPRRREILPFLERLHNDAALPIVYVTHDLEELVGIADHLLLIDQGQLQASGPLQQVLARADLPLARQADAGAVLDTEVLAHDEAYHLSRLGFAGGEMTVSWIDRPVGSRQRIRIHARDVSLALEEPGPSSILNCFAAEVLDLHLHGRGRALVRLAIGESVILARITQKSLQRLGLQPGTRVFAQVKSVALNL